MARLAQYYQRAKNVIHAIQALAIFVAWAMIIALLTKGGKLDGRIWYYFALVGSFPSIISQDGNADPAAVLVLHTCPSLSNRFPSFPTDTPLFQCLRPCCRRYHLHHILACSPGLPGSLGQAGIP